MSLVFCKVSLFVYDQIIYQYEDDGSYHIVAKVPLDGLSKFLVKYCYDQNIDEIHLLGSDLFTTDVKDKILTVNKTKYEDKKELKVILDEKRLSIDNEQVSD